MTVKDEDGSDYLVRPKPPFWKGIKKVPRKITNMESGVEMELFSLYDIARASKTLTYHFIQNAVEDETLETPPPVFKVGSELYWKKDAIEAFEKLAEEDRLADANLSFTKQQLVDLAVKAVQMIGRNVDYRERKIDYRDAYNKAVGVRDFVNSLSSYGIPQEQSDEIRKVTAQLYTNAGSPA